MLSAGILAVQWQSDLGLPDSGAAKSYQCEELRSEVTRMEAGRRDITMIFSKARTLEIPFFQRSYVWEKDEWERFADDLVQVSAADKGYFLGAIILKQKHTGSDTKGDYRIVIDGQQRLTSLVLLFRVLCDWANRPTLFSDLFRNLEGKLILQHNHNDIDVFEAIASGAGVSDERRRVYAENRVLCAYDYFLARRPTLEGVDPMALVKNLYFVGIDLNADEDEQQIFDTINSLGVDLTTAELLKNELYDRSQLALFEQTWLPSFEESEQVKQYWSQAVTAGRARRQNIDLFLQSFLSIQPDVPVEIRVSNLFREYRGYLANHVNDREAFIEELAFSADLYRRNIEPENLEQAIDMDAPIERLNVAIFGLQTTTVLSLVLRILRTVGNRGERDAMLRLLESYLVRRLVSGATTNYYNQFFASLARRDVKSYDSLVGVLTESVDLSRHLPSDSEFAEGFQDANLTHAQARVVLYLLEGSIRDEERHSTALAGYRHYTLEHVMPKKWRNHWGHLPADEAIERDRLVLKMGNFTLLSAALNRSVRDASWEAKRAGTDGHGGLRRFGSGLEIFDEDLERPAWTETTIRERGARLARQAVEVWPYPQAPAGR